MVGPLLRIGATDSRFLYLAATPARSRPSKSAFLFRKVHSYNERTLSLEPCDSPDAMEFGPIEMPPFRGERMTNHQWCDYSEFP